MRKIEIVSQQEYLTSQLGFTSKQYTVDFLPLQKEKNHIFAKYELKVTNEDTKINMKVSCPSDKYLLDYIRIKIVDKMKLDREEKIPYQLHCTSIDNLVLPVNESGYLLLLEGAMPYNTTEG